MPEFYLSGEARFLSLDEFRVARDFMGLLPYQQTVALTGLVLWGEGDPLLGFSHGDLNQLEAALGFPSSQSGPGGGVRPVAERAIVIRDRGYLGDRAAIEAVLATGVVDSKDFV